jgi:hypothetical protein
MQSEDLRLNGVCYKAYVCNGKAWSLLTLDKHDACGKTVSMARFVLVEAIVV